MRSGPIIPAGVGATCNMWSSLEGVLSATTSDRSRKRIMIVCLWLGLGVTESVREGSDGSY
jgi:hypothetical protein